MQFFIDTASLSEIREAASWGVLDGVTTNPTLVAKEGVRDFRKHYQDICGIVKGPVSVEAVAQKREEIVREALELSKIAPNIVVKIPLTAEGLAAVKELSAKGVKTNITLVFSPNQALLAAKAGATYASVFVGRLDDVGNDGMVVARDAVAIYEKYGFKTKIIAASIRHPMHVIEAAKAGAPVATIPFAVLKKMFEHPLTEKGITLFLEDWKKVSGK